MFKLTKIPAILVLFAAISTLFATACKKENTQTDLKEDPNFELVQQSLQASQFITSSFLQAIIATVKVYGLRGEDENTLQVRDACSSPTVVPADLTTYPKTVTSNYGTGCTDANGRTRTGKLSLVMDKFWVIGSVIKARFENYSEEGAKLDGFYNIINSSTLGVINFTFIAENIAFTDKDGKTTAYNIRQTHNQIGGNSTFSPWDDVYEISTVISSTLADGTKFEFVNTTPLKKTNTCWWVQKGTGIVKLNGLPMTLDFGNDTCDDDATLTAGGVVRNIKLRL